MRILVTSNLHGFLEEFKAVLQEAKYNPKQDKLIVLGNFVDEGPHSIKMIDYLMDLQKDGAIILKGFYEMLYVEAFRNNNFRFEQMITKHRNHSVYEYLDNKTLMDRHIDFLSNLKTHHILGKILLSHKEVTTPNGALGIYSSFNYKIKGKILTDVNTIKFDFFKENFIGLLDITNRVAYESRISF